MSHRKLNKYKSVCVAKSLVLLRPSTAVPSAIAGLASKNVLQGTRGGVTCRRVELEQSTRIVRARKLRRWRGEVKFPLRTK